MDEEHALATLTAVERERVSYHKFDVTNLTFEKLEGIKILVISALRKFEHPSHFSLDEVLAVIERLKPDASYLTHMSHLMGLHSQLESELPENVCPAYDGLQISNE